MVWDCDFPLKELSCEIVVFRDEIVTLIMYFDPMILILLQTVGKKKKKKNLYFAKGGCDVELKDKKKKKRKKKVKRTRGETGSVV